MKELDREAGSRSRKDCIGYFGYLYRWLDRLAHERKTIRERTADRHSYKYVTVPASKISFFP